MDDKVNVYRCPECTHLVEAWYEMTTEEDLMCQRCCATVEFYGVLHTDEEMI